MGKDKSSAWECRLRGSAPSGLTPGTGVADLAVDTFVHTPNPYTTCFRQPFPGILIEFQQEGYARYRCRVPLPEREGQVIDLGTVHLKQLKERNE